MQLEKITTGAKPLGERHHDPGRQWLERIFTGSANERSPLHFEMSAWGFRQGLDYKPRADQYTLATKVMRTK